MTPSVSFHPQATHLLGLVFQAGCSPPTADTCHLKSTQTQLYLLLGGCVRPASVGLQSTQCLVIVCLNISGGGDGGRNFCFRAFSNVLMCLFSILKEKSESQAFFLSKYEPAVFEVAIHAMLTKLST